jgi:CRP-like cAMP-binding protein
MSEILRANIEKRIKITEEEWNGIMGYMKPFQLKRRDILLKSGDVCEFNSFIVKGCMRTYFTDEKGHEHIFQIGFEDWWSSDLMSFVTGEPANYSIEALEDCELLQIHRDDYESLLLNFPKYERFFRLLMQGAYVAAQRRQIDSMSYNAERRYLELVKNIPTWSCELLSTTLHLTWESRLKR